MSANDGAVDCSLLFWARCILGRDDFPDLIAGRLLLADGAIKAVTHAFRIVSVHFVDRLRLE